MKQKIDTDSLADLQFSFLLDQLSDMAFSPEGRARLAEPEFLFDNDRIEFSRDVIQEILNFFALDQDCYIHDVPEIETVMSRVEKPGAVLDGEEIWAVKEYLETADMLKYRYIRDDVEHSHITDILKPLPDLTGLIRTIKGFLISPGSVREDHPRIRVKMQQVSRVKAERAHLVNTYVRDMDHPLQARNAVFRDNRVVLPVKAKDKQQFPGVLHASSHSGNTLFIETFELMEKNNAVELAEQELYLEIQKIYRELSQAVAQQIESITLTRRIVGEFDTYYAKAMYARVNACSRPLTSDDGILLIQARHPILRQKAIPIHVAIDREKKIMVMSGPNAGGKTVTLKTIGFLVLMNQLGMHIPAGEGSSLPIFSSVFTDIGDEQSIERELSTFSGHLQRISTILRQTDDKSLVIFDELGAGTDPLEGAALAKAILEYCLTHAGLTLITSHHTILKDFAYSNDQVINASMEFDEGSKTPTYRVILGEPGDSHALDTARRMQMPEEIIKKATEFLGKDVIEVTGLLKSLKRREREIERRERELADREQTLKEKIRDSDLYYLKLRQEDLLRKSSDLSQLQRFIRESRKELEHTIRELREEQITKERIRKAQEKVQKMEETAEVTSKHLKEERSMLKELREEEKSPGQITYQKGDRVVIANSGRTGTLIRRDKKRTWVVQLENNMRLPVPEEKLRLESSDTKGARGSWNSAVSVYLEQFDSSVSSTIDVRGLSLTEALDVLTRQIDKALVSGLREFSIIHGKGEGVLQKGIHDALSDMRAVKGFHFAHPEDGGAGKTIVELQ